MDNPDSEMVFYLMLRAIDRFYQQHSRYPGIVKVEIIYLKNSQNQIAHLLIWFYYSLILSVIISRENKILLSFLFFFLCAPFLGVYNYQVEEDISKLKLCVNSLLQEYSLNVNIKDDYVHEL